MANGAALSQATGRRKTAIARVRLNPGTGAILVNGRPYETYFPPLAPITATRITISSALVREAQKRKREASFQLASRSQS